MDENPYEVRRGRLSINTGLLANGQWTLPFLDQWLLKLMAQIG